ncbi:MAG: exodeoxyribonuclease III, partial [Lactococcus garvieae]
APDRSIYTWFAQRSRTAKINNSGWRIDYWLVSDRIAEQITRAEPLDSGARQDHVPIVLEINI